MKKLIVVAVLALAACAGAPIAPPYCPTAGEDSTQHEHQGGKCTH